MHWKDALPTLLEPLIHHQHIGLICDMDGTLAPIVLQPDLAQVTPRNLELLKALQTHLTVVGILSGRTVLDIRNRVGLPALEYIGNHGLEHWENGNVQIIPQAAAYLPALAAVRDTLHITEEMMIEDKGVTLSIHYRRASDPEQVEQVFVPVIQTLAAQHNLSFFQGRMVFEVRPPLNFNKGTALEYLVDKYRLGAVIFIGDDTTDVDAMLVARRLRLEGKCFGVPVGVLSSESPPAVREQSDVWVYGITEVEMLLDWLLQAISAS